MLDRLELSNESNVALTGAPSSAAPSRRWQSSDDLKAIVRNGLISMEQAEREQLIRDIDREMDQAGLTLCSNLILIGIPAASHSELTPNEVGHLVRFIDMTAPRLMPAIERVLARYLDCWREQETLRPAA
ncbi:MAG TPA: hypothetical protein VF131_13290 [Blastocatellia bacterium]|nr:hypothetical protein [Blastocatellia bacterium]